MDQEDALILEYSTIKQEIFTMMERVDQLIIMEYTISIAFLGVGYEFQSSLLMILNIIYIISIQEMINTRRRHMIRAAIYIEQYIEQELNNLQWESSVGKIDTIYRERYMKKNVLTFVYYFLVNNSTLIIALISCVLFFLFVDCITYWNMLSVLMLILVIFIQCLTYTEFRNLGERYHRIMKEVFKEIQDSKINKKH